MGPFSSMVALTAVCLLATQVAADALADEKAALQCEEYLPIWKVATSPSNTYKLSDDRELRADTYGVGGCPQYESYPTGSQFTGNYTLAGYDTPIGNKLCLIENDIYSSFQAIVVRANGFDIEAKEIDLDDIDSLTRVDNVDTWRESMAIFGKRGTEYITPILKLYDSTMLTQKQYTVTKEGMKEMGFPAAKLVVPGGEFTSSTLYNCPFGRANKNSEKCRMTAKFESPIDTMVIMYAASQKSRIDPNAAVFFSELKVSCGCRCSDQPSVETQSFHPVDGSTSECTVTTHKTSSLRCDVLGNKVCYHDVSDTWSGVKGTGKLPNGNYPCVHSPSTITKITSKFAPRDDFNLRPGAPIVA